MPDDGSGGKGGHVDLKNLAGEGKGARRPHIGLNDLKRSVGAPQHLHVERTSDLQSLCDLEDDVAEAEEDILGHVTCREDERGVARVNASLFNMFGNRVSDNFSLVSNSIDIDLLRALNELGDHHRSIFRHLDSHVQELLQLRLRSHYVHRCSTQDIRRSHENRISNLVAEPLCVLKSLELRPGRLVDVELVEHSRVLLPVLSPVDHLGRRAQHVGPVGLEGEREVVGDLTSEGHDCPSAAFHVVDVQNSLQAELFEVEPVALIEVGRNGLRVAVDHDCLLPLSDQSSQAQDRSVIKLHAASDPVRPTSHHHDAMVVEGDVTLSAVVRHVQVVGLRGELSSQGVNLLDNRSDSHAGSQLTSLRLRAADPLADLPVREASLLGEKNHVLGDSLLVVIAEVVG
mmetsp:Transcript_4160/g.10064  ORF Transcript_4160/g.10064 Transcript_4160/m.10064 type:complete len:401 (+) Transcript_4160:1745-2947(+)